MGSWDTRIKKLMFVGSLVRLRLAAQNQDVARSDSVEVGAEYGEPAVGGSASSTSRPSNGPGAWPKLPIPKDCQEKHVYRIVLFFS